MHKNLISILRYCRRIFRNCQEQDHVRGVISHVAIFFFDPSLQYSINFFLICVCDIRVYKNTKVKLNYSHIFHLIIFKFYFPYCPKDFTLANYLTNLILSRNLLCILFFCHRPMLTESLERLDLSNNVEDESGSRMKTSPLIGTPSINEEIIGQFNDDSEGAEDDIKSSSIRDTICAFSGHSFYRKSLSKPAYCHHCGEVIWSPLSTGFACDGSSYL